jgi:hypothetical protein
MFFPLSILPIRLGLLYRVDNQSEKQREDGEIHPIPERDLNLRSSVEKV